jgi:hypothetical protein
MHGAEFAATTLEWWDRKPVTTKEHLQIRSTGKRNVVPNQQLTLPYFGHIDLFDT